jgi:hypothetical protein
MMKVLQSKPFKQHKEDDKQLFIIVFYSIMQSKKKKIKLPKGGRVQSVLGNIGNGVMELTLEQVLVMAQWSSHWNKQWR